MEIFVRTIQDRKCNLGLLHRGSYMSAHILLNLLNEFGEKR